MSSPLDSSASCLAKRALREFGRTVMRYVRRGMISQGGAAMDATLPRRHTPIEITRAMNMGTHTTGVTIVALALRLADQLKKELAS